MNTSFCLEALEEALARFGKPEIFKIDQGSQFRQSGEEPVVIEYLKTPDTRPAEGVDRRDVDSGEGAPAREVHALDRA